MFNIFKNQKTNQIVPSEEQFNKLLKTLEDTTKDYNKELGVFVSSSWKSELDNNFSVNLDLYSTSGLKIHAMLYIPANINYPSSSSVSLVYKSESDNYPHFVEKEYMDFINVNLQNVIEQMKNKIIEHKIKVKKYAKIKSHVRIWYKDSVEALATYTKWRDNFKYYYGEDYDYEGRFVFVVDTTDIEVISEKFPDADLIEIYNHNTNSYDSFVTEEI